MGDKAAPKDRKGREECKPCLGTELQRRKEKDNWARWASLVRFWGQIRDVEERDLEKQLFLYNEFN